MPGPLVIGGRQIEPGERAFRLTTPGEARLAALGVDVVAYRAALKMLVSGRYPFADFPRRVAGFDDLGLG